MKPLWLCILHQVLSSLITYTSACADDHCPRQEFRKVDEMMFPGDVFIRRGPRPWKKCRRLCRQYHECMAFTVEWQDDTFGMCNLYRSFIKQADLTSASGISSFMSCPDGMEWDEDADVCWVRMKNGSWLDSVLACEALYPGVRIYEPRSQAEQDSFAARADGTGWIGIYRPDGSTDVDELRYRSSGELITYTNWREGEPNMIPDGANCIICYRFAAYTWSDAPCTGPTPASICQI